MNVAQESTEVAIGYTVALEDGTVVGSNTGRAPILCTPGRERLLPALEEAVRGMTKGETKQIVLTHEQGRDLKLDVARLAFVLGYPGENLVLNVEILESGSLSMTESAMTRTPRGG